ncbi:alpha/beta fold hydrolase [Isobaculum melis]|uniref:Pimeloyl-ACP methyl ester carboxylesterase n=1 Tax=Isobaculum melis TaxID=142588 RepID=A0A1H9TSQ8_9LACT|nr:alpha/beta hydrolase [Isobaculum melis]SES00129.1 Pimeloyl-ACP methyl ester carboxylesterase [Isobaculum melis]
MVNEVLEIRGKKVVKEKVRFGAYQSGWFFVENPQAEQIILFLHGGPGSPEFSIFENELLDGFLDEKYAICYLDFLGSGLSFTTKEVTEALLVEQVATVATYLKEKYQMDQMILMGHSYGSYIGMKVLQAGQVEFSAYYGISQVVDVCLSEEALYQELYQLAAAEQNVKVLKQLTAMKEKSSFPSQDYIGKVKSRLVERYHGGVFFNSQVKFKFLKRLFRFKGYTLGEKMNYLRGLLYSGRMLFPALLKANLYEGTLDFDIPIYLIHGEKDLQVSKETVTDFFHHIKSSDKQLVIFPNAAHSPHLEGKKQFMKLV